MTLREQHAFRSRPPRPRAWHLSGSVPCTRLVVFGVSRHSACLHRVTLAKISDFYTANKNALYAVPVRTLDFTTGRTHPRCYTQAKIIDMIFFQEGYKQARKVRR